MARCHPTWRGVKKTSQLGLRYEALGCRVPSMGHRVRQLPATLCVASSLALVALGGSDPTRWVLPSNLELWQTPQQSWDLFWIWLPYPVMYRTHRMRTQMMRKIILLRLFTVLVEPSCFASSVVTPRGYKASGHSCATCIFLHNLPPSLRLLPYS
jgi:hypothetical protein